MRQRLHELIDRLPDAALSAVVRAVAGFAADPMTLAILTAPADDEPYT